MSDKTYNTNLASEFYVLPALHRLGLDAMLTFGNKKSVDLAVVREAGDSVTVDVKGLAGKTGWPVDNVKDAKAQHFLVFVCYRGKIEEVEVVNATGSWAIDAKVECERSGAPLSHSVDPATALRTSEERRQPLPLAERPQSEFALPRPRVCGPPGAELAG